MENTTQIAIIGGGPGGLYILLRLLESGHPYDQIKIFEATEDLGGRVRTLPLKDCPYTAELGAMRYINNRQLIINSLIDKFNLGNQDHSVPLFGHYLRNKVILPSTKDGKIKMLPKNYGKHASKKAKTTDEKSNFKLPVQNAFVLDGDEVSLSPQELVGYAILKALSKLKIEKGKVPREYENSRTDAEAAIEQLRIRITTPYHNNDKDRKFDPKKVKTELKTFSFDSFKLDEWQVIRNAATYHDHELGSQYLYETCLYNILQRELSSEAVTLSQDALGYTSVFSAANAADHIPWFLNEFGNQTYRTIENGMSELVSALEADIQTYMKYPSKKSKSWKNMGHKLLSVKSLHGKYKLQFEDNPNSFTADKVIFSVSKGALERIQFDETFKINDKLAYETGSTKLSKVIQAVTAYPLMKAFLFFGSDWYWANNESKRYYYEQYDKYEEYQKDPKNNKCVSQRINFSKDKGEYHFVSTRILTDLPIRQIYFYGSHGVWRRSDAPADASKAMGGMIMAYGDSREAEYWASLAGRNLASDNKRYCKLAFRDLFNEEEIEKLIASHGVTSALINMLMTNIRQVMKSCGLTNLYSAETEPIAVFMQDWNEAPFYGGWHAWKVNYKPWKVRKHIQRPFDKEEIFISGEVFSPDQGWIEGALRISESILQKHFGLTSPEWLEKGIAKLDDTSWFDKKGKDETIRNYLTW